MTGIVSPGWKQLDPGTADVDVWAAFGEARNKRLGCCGGDDEDHQTCSIYHALTVQHARSLQRDKTAPSLQALAAAVTASECWIISLLRGTTFIVAADRLSCIPLLWSPYEGRCQCSNVLVLPMFLGPRQRRCRHLPDKGKPRIALTVTWYLNEL